MLPDEIKNFIWPFPTGGFSNFKGVGNFVAGSANEEAISQEISLRKLPLRNFEEYFQCRWISLFLADERGQDNRQIPAGRKEKLKNRLTYLACIHMRMAQKN